jgi:hypothetical protein
MSDPATLPSSQPVRQSPIAFIHVEYADGSFDDIRLLHRGICPLFGISRKRPDGEVRDLGPHTSGAIAIILFRTALTTERTEYPFHDPKLIAALKSYFEESSPQKK